jgi:hypothetical protein
VRRVVAEQRDGLAAHGRHALDELAVRLPRVPDDHDVTDARHAAAATHYEAIPGQQRWSHGPAADRHGVEVARGVPDCDDRTHGREEAGQHAGAHPASRRGAR